MAMVCRVVRMLALLGLCTLLVYAPELYAALGAPYASAPPARTLLRVALCTRDADADAAFRRAVTAFVQTQDALHLRLMRVDAQQLAALTAPLPDVCVFSGDALPLTHLLSLDDGERAEGAQTVRRFVPEQGETLWCAVLPDAPARAQALAMLEALCASPTQTP